MTHPCSEEKQVATLNIFVSAEFDRDNELKNHFLALAKEKIPHRVRDCSLHEPYPDERWKSKARKCHTGL